MKRSMVVVGLVAACRFALADIAHDAGVTDAEIAAFREMMLEK